MTSNHLLFSKKKMGQYPVKCRPMAINVLYYNSCLWHPFSTGSASVKCVKSQ